MAELQPTLVSVPDHEYGRTQHYPGHVAFDDHKNLLGVVWHDGQLWCWRTTDDSGFGRCDTRDQAVTFLTLAIA